MASDRKLPTVIFALLVALITIPLVIDHIREQRRPMIAEARVVMATAEDPVFRTGARRVTNQESVDVALALRLSRAGSEDRWLAPVSELSIDDRMVAHINSAEWPDKGRFVRVFWFSVESSILGGRLTAENADQQLRYQTYLAPEMGGGLRATGLPVTHNDDYIGEPVAGVAESSGTVRIYARAEIVEKENDIQSLSSATTLGDEYLFEPDFPAVFRSADLGDGVSEAVGELFGLPGFEPLDDPPGTWNEVTVEAFGRRFTDLVSDRLVVSSWTLAAVAVHGRPELSVDLLTPLGEVSEADDGRLSRRGRNVSWQTEIRRGDLLHSGDRWIVLLEDDGNRILDLADTVLYCWGGPPKLTTLLTALDAESTIAHLFRYDR